MSNINDEDIITADQENNVIDRANAQITKTDGMCYILVEEGDEDDEETRTVFIGTHDQLNLYQIWYNMVNKTMLKVVNSWVPVVRVIGE